jgi:hypothetical protein
MYYWRILPSDAAGLITDERLVRTGLSAQAPSIDIHFDLRRDGIDAYVSEGQLGELRSSLQPIEGSDTPNALLRVPLGEDWILNEPVAPAVVVAADLLDHADPRVTRSARRVFERAVG